MSLVTGGGGNKNGGWPFWGLRSRWAAVLGVGLLLVVVILFATRGRGISEFLFGYQEKYLFFLNDLHLSEEGAQALATVTWALHVLAYSYLSWWVVFRIFPRRLTWASACVALLAMCVSVPMLAVQAWFRSPPREIVDLKDLKDLRCFDTMNGAPLVYFYQARDGSITVYYGRGYHNGARLLPITEKVCEQVKARARLSFEFEAKRIAGLEEARRNKEVEEQRAAAEQQRLLAEEQRLAAEQKRKAEEAAAQAREQEERALAEQKRRADEEAEQARQKVLAELRARVAGTYVGEISSRTLSGGYAGKRFYRLTINPNGESGRYAIFAQGRLIFDVLMSGKLSPDAVFIGRSASTDSSGEYHPDDVKLTFLPDLDRVNFYYRDDYVKKEGSGTLARVEPQVSDARERSLLSIAKREDACTADASKEPTRAHFLVVPLAATPTNLAEAKRIASDTFGALYPALDATYVYGGVLSGKLSVSNRQYNLKISSGPGDPITFKGRSQRATRFTFLDGLLDDEGNPRSFKLGIDVSELAFASKTLSAWSAKREKWIDGFCHVIYPLIEFLD
jgi:hypothetical protein